MANVPIHLKEMAGAPKPFEEIKREHTENHQVFQRLGEVSEDYHKVLSKPIHLAVGHDEKNRLYVMKSILAGEIKKESSLEEVEKGLEKSADSLKKEEVRAELRVIGKKFLITVSTLPEPKTYLAAHLINLWREGQIDLRV